MIMLPPPPTNPELPLTDEEWIAYVRLCQDSILGRNLSDLEDQWLVARSRRIRIRRWPQPPIPPGQLHPDVQIPMLRPASQLAGGGGGGNPEV